MGRLSAVIALVAFALPVSGTTSGRAPLPLLRLAVEGPLTEQYSPATLTYRGRTFRIEAKLRGRSSLEYPQKHMTLRFANTDRFDEPTAGMTRRRRLALTSTFDDTSLVRQRLAFELWNRLEPGLAIRSFSAEITLDGKYHGVYTVTDHVDADLLEQEGLPPASLYKAVDHAAGFFPGPFVADAFEKKHGPRRPIWLGGYSDLKGLWDFVARAPVADFRAGAAARLALDDVRAWLILATAIGATDTLGKNAYWFQEARGPFRVAPWDFNASFGQDWMTGREGPDRDPASLAAFNYLFVRLLEDPVLGGQTRARYAAALRGPLARGEVIALVDGLAVDVSEAVARHESRWLAEHRSFPRWAGRKDFNDFAGEIAYIRRWIEERWTRLEAW